MGSSKDSEYKFYIDFIKLYESKPTLWKCGSEEYKNREEKKRAYQVLVAKFREIDRTANVDTVKRKINSLRSSYRDAKKRISDAQRLGIASGSEWVYFKYFKFLDTVNGPLDEKQGSWGNCANCKIDLEYKETPCEQKFYVDFIKLYESLPALWKFGSDEYKNLKEKERAYQVLVTKLREIDPFAGVDTVKRKINTLRSTYRDAKKRIRDTHKLGIKPGSQWVYFKYFKFLDTIKSPWEPESRLQFKKMVTMGSPTEHEQSFYIDFIKLYESKPVLWKRGSDEYKNRKEKKRAYKALIAKFREIEPTANEDTVKRKINSLRCTYRKIKKMVRDANGLGMEPSSQWVYFKYFKFLDSISVPLEEEEGIYSNCDDSKIELKSAETSLECDGENETTMGVNVSARHGTSASFIDLHRESFDNDVDKDMKCQFSIAAQQQFWIEFIKLYESNPVLWKYGSDIYDDRKLKKRAYSELVEKMREVEPAADVDMVKRKINSLRSTYRRTLNETRRAIRLGLEPDYSWVYFDHFAFLHKNKNPLEGEDVAYEHIKLAYLDGNCDDDKQENEVEEYKDNLKRSYESSTPESSPKRVCTGFEDIVHEESQQLNDEAEVLGIGWALQYRNLTVSQKRFVKNAIDNIFFEARALGHKTSILS